MLQALCLFLLQRWNEDPQFLHARRAPSLPEVRPISVITRILDFRGFDSSIILVLRVGLLMSTGNFPEVSGQGILVGRLEVTQKSCRTLRFPNDKRASNILRSSCLKVETNNLQHLAYFHLNVEINNPQYFARTCVSTQKSRRTLRLPSDERAGNTLDVYFNVETHHLHIHTLT